METLLPSTSEYESRPSLLSGWAMRPRSVGSVKTANEPQRRDRRVLPHSRKLRSRAETRPALTPTLDSSREPSLRGTAESSSLYTAETTHNEHASDAAAPHNPAESRRAHPHAAVPGSNLAQHPCFAQTLPSPQPPTLRPTGRSGSTMRRRTRRLQPRERATARFAAALSAVERSIERRQSWLKRCRICASRTQRPLAGSSSGKPARELNAPARAFDHRRGLEEQFTLINANQKQLNVGEWSIDRGLRTTIVCDALASYESYASCARVRSELQTRKGIAPPVGHIRKDALTPLLVRSASSLKFDENSNNAATQRSHTRTDTERTRLIIESYRQPKPCTAHFGWTSNRTTVGTNGSDTLTADQRPHPISPLLAGQHKRSVLCQRNS